MEKEHQFRSYLSRGYVSSQGIFVRKHTDFVGPNKIETRPFVFQNRLIEASFSWVISFIVSSNLKAMTSKQVYVGGLYHVSCSLGKRFQIRLLSFSFGLTPATTDLLSRLCACIQKDMFYIYIWIT